MRRPLLLIPAVLCLASWGVAQGGELHFVVRAEPKTMNPMLVADEPSQTIAYLTQGCLIRINRATQELEPSLATSWKFLDGGRKMIFQIREGVTFSDGTPFSAEDVVYSFKTMLDPALHSPIGDTFTFDNGKAVAQVTGKNQVTFTFPMPVAGVERLFDQPPIISSRSPNKENAFLGPFVVAEHKAGAYTLLKRNPHYWKHDSAGKQLPYLDAIRLDVQANRDLEMVRFRKGELQLMSDLDAESFERLAAEGGNVARDLGPSLFGEQMWFNQVAKAPLPDYKKAWFRSRNFRRAISEAINRHDLARVVYLNHATPGVGPFSSANKFWFNANLKAHPFDPKSAQKRLEQDGFRRDGDTLRDRDGHPVEFSVITNSGNKSRERMAAMIQQDLKQLGIKLNVVPLDFPSLIERITRTLDYEACMLGLVNIDLDPSGQMNVWPSSAEQHQWNPTQKSPETPWEAEIDKLMQQQASELDLKKRKAAFDRVQEIVWEEAPFIYLVYKNALVAVAPSVRNANPTVLFPQTFWNVEYLTLSK